MGYVQVRDLEMYIEEHGRADGEPLVLLHSFTSTGKAFRPFFARLGEHYRLIVVDQRGHGRTINPSGEIVHKELARDTAALIEALGLRRAHFCGYSSGGMMLLFLALERPELIHSLTLTGATYTYNETLKARVRKAAATAPDAWIESLNATHAETHGNAYGKTIIELWAQAVQRPGEMPFTLDQLRQIKAPTLVVHGDRDWFFPVDIPVAMYQAIPEAELCILPECGHEVLTERGKLFEEALVDFLRRHPFQG